MEQAFEQARRCRPEDERTHPAVGVLVVRAGVALATAYRGEGRKGRHAEFVALEVKLKKETLAGATLYTTLEPCTTRDHPKVPCAQRIAERKIARVVTAMLDPNPAIQGNGVRLLRSANIEVALADKGITARVEELNRDFIRSHRITPTTSPPHPGRQHDFVARGKMSFDAPPTVTSTPEYDQLPDGAWWLVSVGAQAVMGRYGQLHEAVDQAGGCVARCQRAVADGRLDALKADAGSDLGDLGRIAPQLETDLVPEFRDAMSGLRDSVNKLLLASANDRGRDRDALGAWAKRFDEMRTALKARATEARRSRDSTSALQRALNGRDDIDAILSTAHRALDDVVVALSAGEEMVAGLAAQLTRLSSGH